MKAVEKIYPMLERNLAKHPRIKHLRAMYLAFYLNDITFI